MARILVIEDDPASLKLMSYLLSASGHQPITAHDGEQGVRLAGSSAFDLILVDAELPRADVPDVVQRLRALTGNPGVPVVAVASLTGVAERERALAAGFAGCVAKPTQPRSFVRGVESHLGAKPLAVTR
jgi:DNA-binding response OmpR family regulator